MIPAEAGDPAARAVLDMIDRVEIDPESDQFLTALDRIHLQLLSPRAATIVARRAELGFTAHDVNTIPDGISGARRSRSGGRTAVSLSRFPSS